MIDFEVVTSVWGSILDFFGSIKTTMIELFDNHYVALSEAVVATATTTVVAVGVRRGESLPVPGL